MKNDYKHKTGLFGSAGESYVSRLFMLMKHPERQRRPDLISIDNRYSPVLSLEVKSGAKMKGVLVDYQLHYSITTAENYKELFGENPPKRTVKSELFPEPIPTTARLLPGDPIAYYYCVLNRVDGLGSSEIDRPFSTIKCQWGDMFLVHSDLAFYSFIACRVKRSDEDPKKIIPELREMMRRDALDWSAQNYSQRKGKIYSWQNIHGRDILAIFNQDMNLATVDGKDRIAILRDNYLGMQNLARIKINGPNNTSIYILANPEDKDLFDEQVRKTVEERVPLLEKITRARKKALPLLDKLNLYEDGQLFLNETTKCLNGNTLKRSEIARLERLVKWLDIDEKTMSIQNPF